LCHRTVPQFSNGRTQNACSIFFFVTHKEGFLAALSFFWGYHSPHYQI
jgi:hypothetical protein